VATTTKAKTRTRKISRATGDKESQELLKRVETILTKRLEKLENSQGKTSTAELSKILELLERVIEEQPRKVTVQWVEPCEDQDEKSSD
jgi:CRISPR/Cas system-associated protein Csm6